MCLFDIYVRITRCESRAVQMIVSRVCFMRAKIVMLSEVKIFKLNVLIGECGLRLMGLDFKLLD